MEYIIDETSKQSCVNHIINHIRSERYNYTHTCTSCILRVIQLYNNCYPLIYDFLPSVLTNIIIDYVNETFDINLLLNNSVQNNIYYIKFDNLSLNIYTKCCIKIMIRNYTLEPYITYLESMDNNKFNIVDNICKLLDNISCG